MKHFENLWEEAESINDSDLESAINELVLKCQLLSSINDEESFNILYGDILFTLTKISKIKNINVYKYLLKSINDRRKIEKN